MSLSDELKVALTNAMKKSAKTAEADMLRAAKSGVVEMAFSLERWLKAEQEGIVFSLIGIKKEYGSIELDEDNPVIAELREKGMAALRKALPDDRINELLEQELAKVKIKRLIESAIRDVVECEIGEVVRKQMKVRMEEKIRAALAEIDDKSETPKETT